MAFGEDEASLTETAIADLTDGELVEHHQGLLDAMELCRSSLPDRSLDIRLTYPDSNNLAFRIDQEMMTARVEGRPSPKIEEILNESLDRTPTVEELRFAECWLVDRRLQAEMNRRLGEMLRASRVALGLTHRDVGRVAGIHSKFVDEIEQGKRRDTAYRNLFQRACTESGLDQIDPGFHRSVWSSLADPQACRTIRSRTITFPWLVGNYDDDVVTLARSIREGRAFHLLPILGDALEEAGSVDGESLAHCRAPGVHLRSCWVVDVIIKAARSR